MPGFLNSPFVRALVVSVVAAAGSRAAVSSVGGYLVIDNEVGANFSAAGTTGGDYGVAVFGEGTWGNYRHYGNLGLTTTGSWSWGTGNPGDVALADARLTRLIAAVEGAKRAQSQLVALERHVTLPGRLRLDTLRAYWCS